MICLTDNDVLLKLASWNLLEETVEVLETTREEIFVLPTAKYIIKNDRHGKLVARYGPEGISRALDFINSVQTITQGSDPDEQAAMIAVKGIDEGEELLFSATKDEDAFLVATGDKNSLRALSDAPTCAAIYDRLCGRVICLEQIVARLVPYVGFENARSRIVPFRECDTGMKSTFGSGHLAEETTVQRSLAIRINELHSQVGSLLVPNNDWINQVQW